MSTAAPSRRVAFVGTGNIARAHAEALKLAGLGAPALVHDASAVQARAFAQAWGARPVDSLDALLAEPEVGVVHVLTPPESHAAIARRVLEAGKHVLVEKPIATDAGSARALVALDGAHGGARLGVNQNFVFHPAFVRLRALLRSGRIGRVRHVAVDFHPQLRQLAARQFGHWMFSSELNLLLEQAVHPLSQVRALLGPIEDAVAMPVRRVALSDTAGFVPELSAILRAGDVQCGFSFRVGGAYPVWRLTAYGDDGMACADMIADVLEVQTRTAFLEPLDLALSVPARGLSMSAQAIGNLLGYAGGMVRLRSGGNAFQRSVTGAVAHFHGAVAGRHPLAIDAAFGASLVALCDEIARQAAARAKVAPAAVPAPAVGTATPPSDATASGPSGSSVAPPAVPAVPPAPMAAPAADAPLVALVGGTGFIGKATLAALLASGYRVRVMARGGRNLAPVFSAPGVELARGDVRSADDLRRVFAGARYVVNLAHGGGGSTFEQIRAAMVDSAVAVAECASDAGCARVVHVGSIAGLYLGDPRQVVRGDTPPDPQPHRRADYARAKAEADRAFTQACARRGLSWVLLRPGVVVGEGTAPIHSGLGFANNDQHVIGWTDRDDPTPFVLVDDVASAIVGALTSRAADGKAYNLSGDVAMSAREFVERLAHAQGRPLVFHARSPRRLWLEDVARWAIKRAGGRDAPMPSLRDFRSRAMMSRLDCSDAKRDLGWTPVRDRDEFLRRAVLVHA